jgi:WD40 repeat protein
MRMLQNPQKRRNSNLKFPNHQKLLISLRNGEVLVFNLNRRCIEFKTEAGHSETIFDVGFSPSNPELLASCSYDGTIRIWDSNKMQLKNVVDTSKNSPQAKMLKKIIYSISWNQSSSKLACVTINGFCMIYDAPKSKLLSWAQPFEDTPSF